MSQCPELLSGVVDALRNPINGKGPIACKACRRASLKAPGVLPRQTVNKPMMAGIKSINTKYPIATGPSSSQFIRNHILSKLSIETSPAEIALTWSCSTAST
ncbi:hypothetical protein PtA15_5A610 [Puccinia triticina]|uniref:Uncharacterized protein n=1 Tax=Puccinia triticina TaxID=208348 RepID=A0ABY7CIH8_9BASI|nr:uncharacterized protein PtA15_5A610 [Puccinia triticina]WAQ85036.1 hypothetical protein PtA15_5A610 [Puccinia triticina]